MFPAGNLDSAAASSSRAHLWPTIEDYRAWMISETDPKRRKQYQELAINNPTLLVDIYHAATTATPDSPPVRPESVPAEIWESLGYEEQALAARDSVKEEQETPTPGDYKGKRVVKN